MNVFNLRDRVVQDYESFVRSFLAIKDIRIDELVSDELSKGYLWPDPLIQLNPCFEPGESFKDLID